MTCIFNDPHTVDYLENADSAFKEDRLPVDSAQYDNILGFGNFTRKVFDTDSNTRKNHVLGTIF